MSVRYLSLKKVYFDKILKNEKKYEYRSTTKYYEFLEREKIDYLVFHYYKDEIILSEVKKITRIKKPDLNKSINFTDEVYKIELGRSVRMTRNQLNKFIAQHI